MLPVAARRSEQRSRSTSTRRSQNARHGCGRPQAGEGRARRRDRHPHVARGDNRRDAGGRAGDRHMVRRPVVPGHRAPITPRNVTVGRRARGLELDSLLITIERLSTCTAIPSFRALGSCLPRTASGSDPPVGGRGGDAHGRSRGFRRARRGGRASEGARRAVARCQNGGTTGPSPRSISGATLAGSQP